MTVQTDYGPHHIGPVRLVCASCSYASPCASCDAMERAIRRDEARNRREAILTALGITDRHGDLKLEEHAHGY